jgi:hypothetical protein
MSLADDLRGNTPILAAELRPPRAELDSTDGMDAWIDMYHSILSLTRQGIRVFLTDGAVGTHEEHNLRHLIANIGHDAARDRIIPFLTSKHSLEFCLSYAEEARQQGFEALVVLGGDKHVGHPRCLEHAWQLRQAIRQHERELPLGGWANPHADASQQVDFLLDEHFLAEFYLTQVVSHLAMAPVVRFLDEVRRRNVPIPGMVGVFYYRSASPKTLATLAKFIPVPEGLTAEFAEASAVEICARTIRALMDVGVRHIYVANISALEAPATMAAIRERVATMGAQ